jgi:hypothetical protein
MTTQGLKLEQSFPVVHWSAGVWHAKDGMSQNALESEVETELKQRRPPQSASVAQFAGTHCPTADPQRQISPVAHSESRVHP